MELTRSEKMVNWAKTAALLIGAASAAYGGTAIRGEPEAALSYKALAENFNNLRVEFEKERSFVQGFLEGMKQTHVVQPQATCKAVDRSVVPADLMTKPSAAPTKPEPPAPKALLPPTLQQLRDL